MSGFMCGVPVRTARRIATCPNCGIDGWVVSALQSSPYYAPIETCTNCGDMWDWEEGIFPRPFRRGWRQDNIRRAFASFDMSCDCDEVRDRDGYLKPCEHQTRTSGCVTL